MRNIEAIDDPPVPDQTPNFTGGMVTATPAHQLTANQFRLGINTMITEAGVLQTRRGVSYLGSAAPAGAAQPMGMGYLETPAGTKRLLVTFSTGVCKAYDGASWATASGYTPQAGYPNDIVQGLDRLYVTDAYQNMRSWDGTTFTDLGNAATDAPRAKFIVWGTNRLIAAGVPGSPDTVYFSDILDASPGHWLANNRIRVGAGDGDPITGIAMWSKTTLVVFKRAKTYVVDINPTNTVAQFVIDEVPAAVGCVSHRSIARVGRDLWFVSANGVRSLSRVLQGAENEIALSLSLPIENLVKAGDGNILSESAAAFYQGRYLLNYFANYTLPPDWPDMSNKILSFNQVWNQWEGRWTGWTALAFAVVRFSSSFPLLVAATVNGDVVYWRPFVPAASETTADYRDDGTSGAAQEIATTIGTRAAQFGSNANQKRGFAVELEFDQSTAASAAVSVIADGAAAVSLQSVTPSGNVPLTLLHQPPFRTLAFNIASTSGKLALRAVKPTAFLQTMPVGQ